VDVAGGVEKSKGIKDHAKMKKFIAEARKAARA
jgi:phosphoribosylanthranilate isomerase